MIGALLLPRHLVAQTLEARVQREVHSVSRNYPRTEEKKPQLSYPIPSTLTR